MAEDKKDLTNILEYAKKVEATGQVPQSSSDAGAMMEQIPIEKIDNWESLEDYAKKNPMPEPKFDSEPPPEEEAPAPEPAVAANPEPTFPVTPSEPAAGMDFATTPADAPAADAPAADAPAADAPASDAVSLAPPDEFAVNSDFAVPPSSDFAPPADAPAEGAAPTDFSAPAGDFSPPAGDFSPPAGDFSAPAGDFSSPADAAAPAEVAPPSDFPATTEVAPPDFAAPAPAAPEPVPPPAPAPGPVQSAPPPPPPPPPPAAKKDTATPLDKVKKFAQNVNTIKPAVPAAYPFSLMITGRLAPEEREKLMDILSREGFGISELDLEPQFACDKVLIPRISEFAGVQIVQALRAASAQMRLGPSDSIFATADTRESDEEALTDSGENQFVIQADAAHPAEAMPVTSDSSLPSMPRFRVIDVITASASLRSGVVEATSSSEYQEVVESLQRELKYKAFRRGGTAIIKFSVDLSSLGLPTHYRITVTGTAVKPDDGAPREAQSAASTGP